MATKSQIQHNLLISWATESRFHMDSPEQISKTKFIIIQWIFNLETRSSRFCKAQQEKQEQKVLKTSAPRVNFMFSIQKYPLKKSQKIQK